MTAKQVHLVSRNFAQESKAIAMLHHSGRVLSATHRTALRVAIRQLIAASKRGKGYCLRVAQLRGLLTCVEEP